MQDTSTLLPLLGFILPYPLKLITSKVKSSSIRFIITMLLCVAVAISIHANDLKYQTPADLFVTLALIFTESQVVYHLLIKEDKKEEVTPLL